MKRKEFEIWLIEMMNGYQSMAAGESDQLLQMEYFGRADAFEEVISKLNSLDDEKE